MESLNESLRVVRLGMTANYAGHWKSWEGIREYIQNWHDGILESAGKSTPSFDKSVNSSNNSISYECLLNGEVGGRAQYDPERQKLILSNKNISLQRKVLLLGYSKKANHRDVVGHFGEGMKVGALALLREGLSILVATSSDIWHFDLDLDPDFGEKVLTVKVSSLNNSNQILSPSDLDILSLNLQQNDTVTMITGIKPSEWNNFSQRILFLEPASDYVTTTQGSLLFDEKYQGNMFVKGIWISTMENMNVGVNFHALDLDRDRIASLKESEMEHQLSSMWLQAIRKRKDLVPRFFGILQNRQGCVDARHASFYANDEDSELLALHFLEMHGDGSVPVASQAATSKYAQRLQNELQKNIVVCSNALLDILQKSSLVPDMQVLLQSLEQEEANGSIQEYITLSSLADSLLDKLLHALQLLRIAFPDKEFSLDNIDIIQANPTSTSSKLVFQKKETGRIEIASEVFDPAFLHSKNGGCLTKENCKCSEVTICAHLMRIIDMTVVSHAGSLERILSQTFIENCGAQEPFCKEIHQCGPGCDYLKLQNRERVLLKDLELLNTQIRKREADNLLQLDGMKKEIEKLERSLLNEEVIRMNVANQVRKEMSEETAFLKAKNQKLNSSIQSLETERDRDHEMYQKQIAELEEKKSEFEASSDRKHQIMESRILKYHHLLCKAMLFFEDEYTSDLQNSGEDEPSSKRSKLIQAIKSTVVESQNGWKVSCVVCMESEINTVLLPCRHNVLCESCARVLVSCPICRGNIESTMKVFG